MLFEKDLNFFARNQGYGLTIQQSYVALSTLGIIEEIRKENTPTYSHWMFDLNGKILGCFGLEEKNIEVVKEKSNEIAKEKKKEERKSWKKRRIEANEIRINNERR